MTLLLYFGLLLKKLVQEDFPQPHSQALSPLPPLAIRRKTLVAAGHMTTYDTNL